MAKGCRRELSQKVERPCKLIESSTLQLGILFSREIEKYSSASYLDGPIQHQPAFLIRDPATTLHEFNDFVG